MYVSSRSQNNPSQCFISEPNAMIYFSYSIPTMLLFFFFFICSCQCHHTSQSSTSTKTWQETYMNLCQMCILITLSLIWILSYILRHWVWFCNDFTDINKLVFSSCLLILSWTYISNAVICESESLGEKLLFLTSFYFWLLCRPLSVLSQCSFSSALFFSRFPWVQEPIILVGQFFMVVQGFVCQLCALSYFISLLNC